MTRIAGGSCRVGFEGGRAWGVGLGAWNEAWQPLDCGDLSPLSGSGGLPTSGWGDSGEQAQGVEAARLHGVRAGRPDAWAVIGMTLSAEY